METPEPDKLHQQLIDEIVAAGLPAPPADESIVSEQEVEGLPGVVQCYLRFMRMVGRPRDRSFCAQFVGRFRLRKRLGWMPAEAWSTTPRPTSPASTSCGSASPGSSR